MYKQCLPAIVLLSASLVAGCGTAGHRNKGGAPALWQNTPIVVDGFNTDWPSPYAYYDEKAMLGYMVSNDSANLYITVETGDPATQLKIVREGLTVWIDKTGKEACVTAINYPIPQSNGDKDRMASAEGHADMHTSKDIQKRMLDVRTRIKNGLEKATEYSLQGFKGCNLQFPTLAANSCGIEVRLNIDQDNEMIWEAKIPFRAFYFKPSVDRTDRSRQLGICLETTGAKRPQGTAGSGNNSRRRGGMGFRPSVGIGGGGMGMSMGGGRAGSGGDAPDPNANMMEALYKNTKTWFHAGIATR